MNLNILDTQNDDYLRSVIAYADDLLKRRDRERKAKAVEDAAALLASVGLSLKEAAGQAKPRTGNKQASPTYHAGHIYRHPDDPNLTFKAGGSYPKWVKELHAAGRKAEAPENVTAEKVVSLRQAAT